LNEAFARLQELGASLQLPMGSFNGPTGELPMSTQDSIQLPALAPRVQIRTLGGLRIEVANEQPCAWRSAPRRQLALLCALIAAGRRGLATSAACDVIWPDADPHDAYRALITTTYRLRRLLCCVSAVEFCGGMLRLNEHLVWVDAWDLERALTKTLEPEFCERLLDAYAGSFWPGADYPHANDMRERIDRKVAHALGAVARSYEQRGDSDRAIALYERAIEMLSTSEELHRELMRCLIRAGRAGAAAEIFQRCRTMLARRFGVSPSNETVKTLHFVLSAACDQRVTSAA
jgi:two-component SAPR family response regulator